MAGANNQALITSLNFAAYDVASGPLSVGRDEFYTQTNFTSPFEVQANVNYIDAFGLIQVTSIDPGIATPEPAAAGLVGGTGAIFAALWLRRSRARVT